jgi:hypothetical protein
LRFRMAALIKSSIKIYQTWIFILALPYTALIANVCVVRVEPRKLNEKEEIYTYGNFLIVLHNNISMHLIGVNLVRRETLGN